MLVGIENARDTGAREMHVFDVAGIKVNIASVATASCLLRRMYSQGVLPGEGQADGTTVTCLCHGSQFDVKTGVVLRGTAQGAVRSRLLQMQGESLLVES